MEDPCIIILAFDAIISIVLLNSYNRICKYIDSLQDVISINDSNNLRDVLSMGNNKYVEIHGPVKALGKDTIESSNDPSIRGVVRKSWNCHSLRVKKPTEGWSDKSKHCKYTYKTNPFAIALDQHEITVEKVEDANRLHLDTIYKTIDEVDHSFTENLHSSFSGKAKYVVETREEMLIVGSIVTGIGDLVELPDHSITLQPPVDGKPFFIIRRSLPEFLHDLDNEKSSYRNRIIITNGIAISLLFAKLFIWRR